jgi:hypothetical protein
MYLFFHCPTGLSNPVFLFLDHPVKPDDDKTKVMPAKAGIQFI